MEINLSIAQVKINKNQFHENVDKTLYLIDQLEIHKNHMLLLPELWSTGYTTKLREASINNLGLIELLTDISKEKEIVICGSYILQGQNDAYFNRLVIVTPDAGPYAFYDKTKLFKQMNEHQLFNPGNSLSIASIFKQHFGLSICYDLRFPEIYRQYAQFKPEFHMIPSQWPLSRIEHFNKLLMARAIENQSFFISSNAIDYSGKTYFGGNSKIIDFMGDILLDMEDRIDEIGTVQIKTETLENWRNEFPVLDDMDNINFTKTDLKFFRNNPNERE